MNHECLVSQKQFRNDRGKLWRGFLKKPLKRYSLSLWVMTEPKTAPKRKSSTSLRSSIPLLELSVTVQTGTKQKKRLFIFPSSSVLLLEAPDAHALGHGESSAQQHEDSKCPWDDFNMQTSIHGHSAASNKQFLHQNLYYGILHRNHRKIFELKQGSFLCPQYLRSSCQNTSYLPNILILFGFNGSLTLFASTLISQKTKSCVAFAHMQIHLTTLSGAKKGFLPWFVCWGHPLTTESSACPPAPGSLWFSSEFWNSSWHQRFMFWPWLHTQSCSSLLQLLQPLTTGHRDALLCGRQRHSPQLPKRPPLPTAAPHLS